LTGNIFVPDDRFNHAESIAAVYHMSAWNFLQRTTLWWYLCNALLFCCKCWTATYSMMIRWCYMQYVLLLYFTEFVSSDQLMAQA